MPAVASGPPLGRPEPAPPPPPSADEVRTAVRVLRAFAAEGRFDADLEAASWVLGTLLHALHALGGGAAAAGAPPRPAERGWRARWFPSRAEQLRRFEAENTLGVESSCVSGATWEVSHPAWDPDAAYTEAGAPPFLVGPDESIRIPQWDARLGCWATSADTEISLQPYTDAAGNARRLKLRLWRVARRWAMRAVDDARDDFHPVDRRELVEEKLVRAASGDGVDARVVVFRCKRPGGATHYFRIRLSGTGDEFELREVRPVAPPPPATAAGSPSTGA